MDFADKIIEKIENKIQKIKKKRESKEFYRNLKKQLNPPNGFRWWFTDESLDLCNIPQGVRYPQCEFLIGKSLIRYLESKEFKGKRIHHLEIVKKDNSKEN